MTTPSRILDGWLARRHPLVGEAVTVSGRRVYILPTRNGWLFALLIALLLVGANHYANNMAFMLAFLLVGVGLNAMWRTVANLRGLVVHRGGAAPVHAGRPLTFVHVVENPGRATHDAVLLVVPDGEAAIVSIPAGGAATVELPVPTSRRGPHREGRLTLATVHPLGLFRGWTWVEFDTAVLVWPRPARSQPPIPSDGGRMEEGAAGAEEEADHGDLSGLQQWRPGDPPRRIAWKAVARTGTMVSKSFTVSSSGDEVWADWSALGSLDIESRLSALCRWLLDAAREGRPCGLRLPGTTIPPAVGDAHLRRALDRLALYGKEG